LQVITLEAPTLKDNKTNSESKSRAMEKPSPTAVPEFACILSLYAGELAETESNRS
jgi:hypothetical protein